MSDSATPEVFSVKFETTCGDFTIEVTRAWAPIGADRFYEAIKAKFYDDCGFFRVVPNFVVQFGINGDPEEQSKWRSSPLQDDPVTQPNSEKTITFATAGQNTRTTQVFINYSDNNFLDAQGFSPFGKVTEGWDVVTGINAEYEQSPSQGQIQSRGNSYLRENFPNLDYIKQAYVIE